MTHSHARQGKAPDRHKAVSSVELRRKYQASGCSQIGYSVESTRLQVQNGAQYMSHSSPAAATAKHTRNLRPSHPQCYCGSKKSISQIDGSSGSSNSTAHAESPPFSSTMLLWVQKGHLSNRWQQVMTKAWRLTAHWQGSSTKKATAAAPTAGTSTVAILPHNLLPGSFGNGSIACKI